MLPRPHLGTTQRPDFQVTTKSKHYYSTYKIGKLSTVSLATSPRKSISMAFSTEIPMDVPTQGYFIYRDSPLSQPYDPTALPVFFPPKDSDELFYALRAKFPHAKTHSERMRDAIIEFLMEERQAELLSAISRTITAETTTTSPWPQSYTSFSSGSGSTWSSPETLNLATPTFGNSPHPQAPQLSRQFSTAGSIATSAEPSPPALDRMTGVFSLSSTEQPKQRIRRKMTEAEKAEYRKRRIVKACDKCAKRKRKCHHNQPEMEILTANTTHKVSKSPTTTTEKKASVAQPKFQEQQTSIDYDSFIFDDPLNPDMQLFDDFTNFFEEPMPDFPLDQDEQFNRLIGVSDGTSAKSYTHAPQCGTGVRGNLPANAPLQIQNRLVKPSAHAANADDALHSAQIQRTPDYNMVLKTEPLTLEPVSTINTRAQRDGRQAPNGNGLLWEHLRTGQVVQNQPTHSPRVEHEEGGNAYVFDSTGMSGSGGTGPQCPRTALAQIVLRLTGTTKAVRAFGSLLNPRTPASASLLTVSVGRVAGVLREVRQRDEQLHASRPDRDSGAPWRIQATTPHDGRKFGGPSPGGTDAPLLSQQATNGPLEKMRTADYLRMKTNFASVEQEGSSAFTSVPTIRRTQKKFGYIPLASPGEDLRDGYLATTSEPASSRSALQSVNSAPQQEEGRPTPTTLAFGESIDRSASPSAELYRLKRRIPKALHSIVDRNHNSLDLATSIHANGGAYLRLDARKCNSPIELQEVHTGPSAYADQPAHTSSQNPRSDGHSWDLERADPDHGPQTLQTAAHNATHHADPRNGGRDIRLGMGRGGWPATGSQLPASMASVLQTSTTASASLSEAAPGRAGILLRSGRTVSGQDVRTGASPQQETSMRSNDAQHVFARAEPQEERLRDYFKVKDHHGPSYYEEKKRDTKRYRDHNGEHNTDLAQVLCVLAAACLLASTFSSLGDDVSASLLLLALCAPVSGKKGEHFRDRAWSFFAQVWGALLQCSIKNSAWLAQQQFNPAAGQKVMWKQGRYWKEGPVEESKGCWRGEVVRRERARA